MQGQQGRRLEDNRGTDQPARADPARTQTGDHRSAERRFGDRFRDRFRISSWCLTSIDSATTARAPPGPASRAMVVSRCRNRMAKSRTARSYQHCDRDTERSRICEFAMDRSLARCAHSSQRIGASEIFKTRPPGANCRVQHGECSRRISPESPRMDPRRRAGRRRRRVATAASSKSHAKSEAVSSIISGGSTE
jgi:hypothetical protein